MRTHYLEQLESVRRDLVEMGETTLRLFGEAVLWVLEPNGDRLAGARELEAKTDQQHRLIHDQCLNLIALQAPVARDARFVTGTLDAIVDLELIGDYSDEIVTLACGIPQAPRAQALSEVSEVAKRVREILVKAIDSWRTENAAEGLSIRPQESVIREECSALYDRLTQLTSQEGGATSTSVLCLFAGMWSESCVMPPVSPNRQLELLLWR
jgi:phosphate transport system protein